MPERGLVYQLGGGETPGQSMATRLQPSSSAFEPRQHPPFRVRGQDVRLGAFEILNCVKFSPDQKRGQAQ